MNKARQIDIMGFLIASLTLFAMLFKHRLFFHDDAFISLRYARNLAEHGQITWNLGEYSEGYTNFLYVLMTALPIKFGADPALTAQAINVIAALLLLLIQARAARILLPRRPIRTAPRSDPDHHRRHTSTVNLGPRRPRKRGRSDVCRRRASRTFAGDPVPGQATRAIARRRRILPRGADTTRHRGFRDRRWRRAAAGHANRISPTPDRCNHCRRHPRRSLIDPYGLARPVLRRVTATHLLPADLRLKPPDLPNRITRLRCKTGGHHFLTLNKPNPQHHRSFHVRHHIH